MMRAGAAPRVAKRLRPMEELLEFLRSSLCDISAKAASQIKVQADIEVLKLLGQLTANIIETLKGTTLSDKDLEEFFDKQFIAVVQPRLGDLVYDSRWAFMGSQYAPTPLNELLAELLGQANLKRNDIRGRHPLQLQAAVASPPAFVTPAPAINTEIDARFKALEAQVKSSAGLESELVKLRAQFEETKRQLDENTSQMVVYQEQAQKFAKIVVVIQPNTAEGQDALKLLEQEGVAVPQLTNGPAKKAPIPLPKEYEFIIPTDWRNFKTTNPRAYDIVKIRDCYPDSRFAIIQCLNEYKILTERSNGSTTRKDDKRLIDVADKLLFLATATYDKEWSYVVTLLESQFRNHVQASKITEFTVLEEALKSIATFDKYSDVIQKNQDRGVICGAMAAVFKSGHFMKKNDQYADFFTTKYSNDQISIESFLVQAPASAAAKVVELTS